MAHKPLTTSTQFVTPDGANSAYKRTYEGITSADISGLAEAIDDQVATLLTAGANVTLTYNDGAGTLTIAIGQPVATVTIDTTLTASHYTVLVDASGGAVEITLPSAAAFDEKVYNIKKIDSTGNAVTISGAIDGESSIITDTQWDCYSIHSDGTQWYQI